MPDITQRTRSFVVPWPVVLMAGLVVALLLAFSGAYGFLGDEMYFVVAGRHPAFGYVDQPPLTPLLSAASVGLLGVSPTAVRVLPAVEAALVVVLVALISRDLGGSRRAQFLAAVTATVSGYLAAGHMDTTTGLDLLAWALILWLAVRLLAGADRRLWLAVGLTAGIGLQNKDTLLFLAAGLALGLLAARRWDVVRSPWPWAAIGIALLFWAPNLVWQAMNGWPQLTMASRIAGYAADNRAQIVPLLWLFTGPILFTVSLAGAVWLLRSRNAVPWRAIGIAGPIALVLVVATGGKPYYAIGTAAAYMAAGSIVVDRWLVRGHASIKGTIFTAAALVSGLLLAYLTLPVLPLATYAASTLPATVQDTANQIGWPAFVSTVKGAVAALPADERARAVILTNDYSEASALDLLGSELPPIYSGHNSYWSWGPPPAQRTVVVHVGDWRPADWSRFFVGCQDVARIDNGLGVPNGEQGKAVSVCTGLKSSWTAMWPGLRTIS